MPACRGRRAGDRARRTHLPFQLPSGSCLGQSHFCVQRVSAFPLHTFTKSLCMSRTAMLETQPCRKAVPPGTCRGRTAGLYALPMQRVGCVSCTILQGTQGPMWPWQPLVPTPTSAACLRDHTRSLAPPTRPHQFISPEVQRLCLAAFHFTSLRVNALHWRALDELAQPWLQGPPPPSHPNSFLFKGTKTWQGVCWGAGGSPPVCCGSPQLAKAAFLSVCLSNGAAG